MLLLVAVFAVGRVLSRPMEPVPVPFAWAMWALVVPQAWVSVARLHDRGLSGWWAVLLVAPVLAFGVVQRLAPAGPEASPLFNACLVALSIVGLPALLGLVAICGLLPGSAGPNRFGADPRAR